VLAVCVNLQTDISDSYLEAIDRLQRIRFVLNVALFCISLFVLVDFTKLFGLEPVSLLVYANRMDSVKLVG